MTVRKPTNMQQKPNWPYIRNVLTQQRSKHHLSVRALSIAAQLAAARNEVQRLEKQFLAQQVADTLSRVQQQRRR